MSQKMTIKGGCNILKKNVASPIRPDVEEKPIYLRNWEEAVGNLGKIQREGIYILVPIGPVSIIIPPYLSDQMEQVLRPLQGMRVAILRTDIPGKEYLVRVIGAEKANYDRESAAIAYQARAAEMNDH